MNVNPERPTSPIRDAVRFWERARLLYTAILAAIVLLWLLLTWPHFRPSLALGTFEAFLVLCLAANLCFCAAYLAEIFMQALVPPAYWRRFRQTLFVLGTLFAIVLENYWIADEIYPYPNDIPSAFFGGATTTPAAHLASNMNFPAPLAVLGFLAACAGIFLALVSVLIFWFARKPRFARLAANVLASGAVVYFALLFGFSVGSHSTTLARGQEKYFCEIDCHLAYSIVDVKTQPDGHYLVTLRTRFDETTTSPNRPKNVPLTPSPRTIHLLDDAGHEYSPTVIAGMPLTMSLKPGESYTTQLEFTIPKDAKTTKLLLSTQPGWPDHFVIGDENSLLHAKTYFALEPSSLNI